MDTSGGQAWRYAPLDARFPLAAQPDRERTGGRGRSGAASTSTRTAHGCTIITVHYLPRGRVLAESFLAVHPGGRFTILVTDDPARTLIDDNAEPFRVVRPGEVGLPDEEFLVMAGIYDVMELSTAVKPWLLRHLLQETGEPLLYLDPDIEVFGPLDDLFTMSRDYGLVVTPHLLTPLPSDGRHPDAADILMAGIYNLGFLGIGPEALENGFLDFWSRQLRRDAIVDPGNMLFTDQRWVDFIDCYRHTVVRDPTVNLAYWNVWSYELVLGQDEVLVEGRPIRFFHYSGFDPREPHLLTRHQNRVRLADSSALAALCRNYADALSKAGQEDFSRVPYGWGRCGDLELSLPLRRIYRSGVVEAEKNGLASPPCPFGPDNGEGFVNWLREPVPPAKCGRYLRWFYSTRPDLQHAFPRIDGNDCEAYLRWASLDDSLRGLAPPQLVPAFPRSAAPESASLPGVNFAGYLSGGFGVGEAARLVLRSIATSGLPVASQQLCTGLPNTPFLSCHGIARTAEGTWPYDLNVLCVNADMMAGVREELGADAFDGRRTVGVWFWETPRLRPEWRMAWQWVEEVWACSRFTLDALQLDAAAPVRLFPLPVEVPSYDVRLTRDDLGLPEGFFVLNCFDAQSVVERKNPGALIDAYCKAFSPDDGATLVIKTLNRQYSSVLGSSCWKELERLRLAVDRPDVVVMDAWLSETEMRALMAHCDCYASLHRSEGFGLSLAEAMAWGKPTIATAYSGNLDFMDEDIALMVPAALVPIPESCWPYGGTGSWAEPDVDVAADYLRWVFEDSAGATALGQRARDHIASTRTIERAGRFVVQAVDSLRGTR